MPFPSRRAKLSYKYCAIQQWDWSQWHVAVGGVCHDLAADAYLFFFPPPCFYDDGKENKWQPLLLSLSLSSPDSETIPRFPSTIVRLMLTGTGERIGVNQRATWDTRFQVERDIYKDARAPATIDCCVLRSHSALGCKSKQQHGGKGSWDSVSFSGAAR